jgi:hypothetical protein
MVKVGVGLDCSGEFTSEGLDTVELTDQGADAIVIDVLDAKAGVVAGLGGVAVKGIVEVEDVIEGVVEVERGAAVEVADRGKFAP